MSISDEDEDLKLAIALSMQQIPSDVAAPQPHKQEIVDLVSDTDEEDEDIRRAIAISLEDAGHSPIPEKSSQPTQSSGSSTLHGLDRKAMEEERLARLGKRKRESSPERASKQSVKSTMTKPEPQSIMTSIPPKHDVLQYPRGTIKRTFATKFPRTDDITIDEVLQADSVHIAVLSSFMWDQEWIHKKLNPLKTKQIWIMNAKWEDVQQRFRQDLKDCGIPNLKIHFPPMSGMIQHMHSKYMLLFSKEKLRIVVPTANMILTDWGEVKNDWQPGVMENSVFFIDVPRRSDGLVGSKDSLTSFGKELVFFLEQQKVDGNVIEGVLKMDFSQTSHLSFVHSIGGAHKGELQHATGLPGLSKAIRDLQLDDVDILELDYAASSLGAINDSLLQRLYLAACGKAFDATPPIHNIRDRIRIYFPLDEQVKQSIGGPDCGGIISLAHQHYHASTFPRECLRNYDSDRRGMLSHNKLLLARGRKRDGSPLAWVYIGSANMSESAWGGQKVLKSGQMGSLNVRNWECGVVVPVPSEKLGELKLGEGEIPPMSIFKGTVEVPFVCPGEQYGSKQPWLFKSG